MTVGIFFVCLAAVLVIGYVYVKELEYILK